MSRPEDYGTAERHRRGKVVKVTADVTSGGMEISQCCYDEWATYPRFLHDIGLLLPEELDAAVSYENLYTAAHIKGGGSGAGNGNLYQRWIDVTQEIGPKHRKVIDNLVHSTPPSYPITEAEIMTAEGVVRSLEGGSSQEAIESAVEALRVLTERRHMQIAVVNAHKISFRMMKKAACEALLCVAEAMRKFTE